MEAEPLHHRPEDCPACESVYRKLLMKHPLLQHEIDREAKLTADRDRLRAALRELVEAANIVDASWDQAEAYEIFRTALLRAQDALKGKE